MTDEEWEQQRERAIATAFQTGRAVFADSNGRWRYADGDCEPIAEDVGMLEDPTIEKSTAQAPLPRAVAVRSWWMRVRNWWSREGR